MTEDNRIKVWCLIGDQMGHVLPVQAYMGDRAEFFYDTEYSPQKMLSAKPDIVLCINDFQYAITRCIDAARENNIPSLKLQDGILEWRCQYENPNFGAGGGAPQHQPVIADKIACIGYSSARQIAFWGNTEKVEVTGMPRLDYLLGHSIKPSHKPGNRILVMTAKKPWFSDEQREVTLRSLIDLKNYLETRPDLTVIWRLTKNVASLIGVENKLNELSTQELTATLGMVDAVVTTISTTVLESMLASRPVAALDYHNVPRFVPTAWTILTNDHIAPVVNEILNPPETKITFQNDILSDVVRRDGKAAEHVARLITEMTNIGRAARKENTSLVLPVNILEWSPFSSLNQSQLSLIQLYPDQEIFLEKNVSTLQVKLIQAEAENVKLRQQLAQRSLGFWIDRGVKKVMKDLFHLTKSI